MRIRTLFSVVLLLCLMTACSIGDVLGGDDSSGGSASTGSEGPTGGSEPSDKPTSGGAGLGEGEGLCSWVTPEQVEQVFGTPMDAVSLGGETSCRLVAPENTGTEGVYHVEVTDRAYAETKEALQANSRESGNRVCDRKEGRWKGMRVLRHVTCQPSWGGQVQTGGPSVILELELGRVLGNAPFGVKSDEEAVEAGKTFETLLKAFARNMRGLPLINEFESGKWIELYNPTRKPYDLTGHRIEGKGEPLPIAAGATIPPKGYLVVELAGLGADADNNVVLRDPDGRPVDFLLGDIMETLVRGNVIRRNGDGGPYCGFGTKLVTKGKANPRFVEHCDE
jgi:hypothetical protein